LPLNVRRVEAGILFSLSYRSKAVVFRQCAGGFVALSVPLIPGALGVGWRLVVSLIGGLAILAGLRTARSKVLADADALRYRTVFGWRELNWTTIAGFQVDRTQPIWIVRVHGRALRPAALASDSLDEAHAKIDLLHEIAPGVALIE
jgi:Bacterial PH domain